MLYSSDTDKNLTPIERIKQLTFKYGTFGIVVYLGISLISLGLAYVAVSSGLDVASLINVVYTIDLSQTSQHGVNFALAYAAYKLLMPFRVAASVYLAPKLHQYWKNALGK